MLPTHAQTVHNDSVMFIVNVEHLMDPALDINGKDLLQMGFGGKDIGIGLELALNGVIDEKVENKKEELKGYIESNFKRQDKDNT